MKLLLCFALGSLAFLVINSEKIKIQIESEDLVNIFEGVMYSEILQKFASQLVRRSVKKGSLDNPYHPEDELMNSFKAGVDKATAYVSSTPKLVATTDPLENQNDQFLIGNDVASDDILTDAEDMRSINELVERHNLRQMASNSTTNSTNEDIEIKKKIDNAVNNNSVSSKQDMKISGDTKISGDMKIFGDDRAYFKPVQRRFVLKGSNDTRTNTLIL